MADRTIAPGVPSRGAQIAGSILAAVVIVVVTILLVTAKIGADPEFLQERQDERLELREDRLEDLRDLQEP